MDVLTSRRGVLMPAPRRALKSGGLAAVLLLGLCRPGRGQMPSSNLRVTISTAAVTGLACRRRAFALEFTTAVRLNYKKVDSDVFTSDPDPQMLALGIPVLALLVPAFLLAPPADLAAAPWRKECDFTLTARGALVGWAGVTAGPERVSLAGRNILSPGIEGIAPPVYDLRLASATADGQGRFSIFLTGHVGRSADLELAWKVNALPSGAMVLRKRGGRFTLFEPAQPEFGAAADTGEESAPIQIRPQSAP